MFNIVPLQHDIQGKCLFIKYHHLVLGGLDFCQTPCPCSPLKGVNNPHKKTIKNFIKICVFKVHE